MEKTRGITVKAKILYRNPLGGRGSLCLGAMNMVSTSVPPPLISIVPQLPNAQECFAVILTPPPPSSREAFIFLLWAKRKDLSNDIP
ncbi:hypothetical protein HNY73_013310 [Argiope bruennichi]|uniref:Uncharacterized protein n=1 Tax=Argiope bruennichi TaxID=94029 RepID=A0A8T0F3K0_ARGBR|nr:hypothetical protein HNY73_013310 [Argiope bruennichi]